MANIEFKLRERDFGYYPQGLIFGFNVLESWLYGGDPAANLEVGDIFVSLKQKMQEGYFEQLIRDILLENPHSAKVTLHPSYQAGEERRSAELSRIQKESAIWTAADRAALAAEQEALLAWQNTADTPEMLAAIPQLSLEDIPAEPENIPTQTLELAGLNVICHALNTSGVAYVSLYFDADGCTEDDLTSLAFACSLLGKTATQNHTAEEIIRDIQLLCGNFRAYPAVYTVAGDHNRVTTKLCVTFSSLESKLPEALKLVCEVVTQSVFSDEAARDILRQVKMQLFQRIVMAGNAVGIGRIAAQTSPAGVAEECTSRNWNDILPAYVRKGMVCQKAGHPLFG